MKRTLHTILLLLVAGVTFAQSYPRKCTEEDIPSSERKAYFEQVERFLRNYYDLLLGIKNSESKNDFISHNFKSKEDSNYLPEFIISGQQNNFITPTQYLLEFEKKLKDYDWDNLEFEISDFNHNKDIMLQNAISSYITSEYILTLRDSENIIFKSKCEAFCYFPKTMSHVTVKMMQVKAIEDIISYKHPVQIITQSLYEEATVLYKNHKYKEAVDLFEQAAKQGHIEACYWLGKCYHSWEGVQILYKDSYIEAYKEAYKEAVKWYTKAAEQGHVDAQYALRGCYYRGEGVSKNLQKAFEWEMEAAKQGHALACYSLANKYEEGYRIKEDGKDIILVKKSKKQYNYWLLKGLEDSNIKNIKGVAWNLWWNRQVEGTISYSYTLQLKRESEYSFMYAKKVAVEHGDSECQFYLGTYYMYGIGTKKNYGEGIKWTTLAAEQGHEKACWYLASYYKEGKGVEKNMEKFRYWYDKADNK